MRSLAAALGVVILLYALVHAAPVAVDQEVADPANSSHDDFALSITQFSTELGGWVPVMIGLMMIVAYAVAAT
jgi:hypothetical protein